MAQNTTTTSAEQFKNMDARTRNNLKHDAWSAAVEWFQRENPEQYDELDKSDKVSWDGMELEIYQDENGRDYFHIVTGVTGGPGDSRKQIRNHAVEFMNVYRAELCMRV